MNINKNMGYLYIFLNFKMFPNPGREDRKPPLSITVQADLQVNSLTGADSSILTQCSNAVALCQTKKLQYLA